MRRIKLIVAYDGTGYCGWQVQSNGITIEEVLNKTLSKLLGEEIYVIGASRTDSGVHAQGNVAVFDTSHRIPADKICFALNQKLPDDIRILASEEVSLCYHPRRQNCIKTYEYKIVNRKTEIPTLRLYAHFCYVPLDVGKMSQAAEYLLGEHDFKSFCSAGFQSEDTVRTIYRADVTKEEDVITILISGNGFLYNMVRIIAGTLLRVGMGVFEPQHMEFIIDQRNRQKAGPKAPAKGLMLKELQYETSLSPVISAENKQWKYELIQTDICKNSQAYLKLYRCREEDYSQLIGRVVHQAVRNGAKKIFLKDYENENRLGISQFYGYYQFHLTEIPFETDGAQFFWVTDTTNKIG